MAALKRVNGCKGRLYLRTAGSAPEDPYFFMIDMTSFTFDRTAENTTFKVLGSCADQSGEGTTAYTLSGEGQYATIALGTGGVLAGNGQQLVKEGQLVDWKFYLDEEGDPSDFISGTARTDNISMSVTPDENTSFSWGSTGDGDYSLGGDMW